MNNSKEKELALILKTKKEQLAFCRTPEQKLKEYREKTESMRSAVNSTKKKFRKELNDIETEYKFLENDLIKFDAVNAAEYEYTQNNLFKKNTEEYISGTIHQLIANILIPNGFILRAESEDNCLKITDKGLIATHLQEVHPLAMADMYTKTDGFQEFTARDLAAIFSCFTNLNVPDDLKKLYPNAHSYPINKITLELNNALEYYEKLENSQQLDSGSSYEINFDIQTEILDWCACETEEDCKKIIEAVKRDKNISLGDFVKAILKINNIAKEIEKICDIKNNIVLLEKIKQIPVLTLKYVVTNQSLYL